MPDRFLDHCSGWRYAEINEYYEEGAVPEGYGVEEYDDAPIYPPEGVTEEQWRELNQAERRLVWNAFWTMEKSDFEDYIGKLRQARSEAEQWSAAVEDSGATDGPQDALRHAYWNCRMSQLLGEVTARAWGNAHEKYSDKPASARMDLHNNARGREVARTFASCAEGVLRARTDGLLRLTLAPAPSSVSPLSPPPEQPPEEI